MVRKNENLLSGVFFLACAIGLCIRAVHLGLGQVNDPGAGFTIFLAAGFLGLMSIVLVFSSIWLQKNGDKKELGTILWDKIGLILLSLIIYGIVLRRAGFVFSTFLLIAILLRLIELKKWYVTIIYGIAFSFGAYVVFELLLQVRLPKGFLGF